MVGEIVTIGQLRYLRPGDSITTPNGTYNLTNLTIAGHAWKANCNGKDYVLKLTEHRHASRHHRELEMLRFLNNRGVRVVTPHETFEGDTALGIALPWINETDAHTHINEKKKIPLEEANEFVMKAASGLSDIHKQGASHGDVKTGNVFYESGTWFDFQYGQHEGVAPIRPDSDDFFFGTILFVAPEHMYNKHFSRDALTDIYSMGATAYHMLTGTGPYNDTCKYPRELFRTKEEYEPTPPHKLREEITEALSGVVLKAMAREREERYQTLEAFMDDYAKAARITALPRPEPSLLPITALTA